MRGRQMAMRRTMIENQLRRAEFARGAEEEAAAASGKDPLVTKASQPKKGKPDAKPTPTGAAPSLVNVPRDLALSNRIETLADTIDKLRTEAYLLSADCVVEGLPVFTLVPQTKKDLVGAAVKKLSHDESITVGHPHVTGACGLVFMRKLECDPVTSAVTVLYVPVGVSSGDCAEGLNAIGAEGKKTFLQNFAFSK